jgi:hypothetical protein
MSLSRQIREAMNNNLDRGERRNCGRNMNILIEAHRRAEVAPPVEANAAALPPLDQIENQDMRNVLHEYEVLAARDRRVQQLQAAVPGAPPPPLAVENEPQAPNDMQADAAITPPVDEAEHAAAAAAAAVGRAAAAEAVVVGRRKRLRQMVIGEKIKRAAASAATLLKAEVASHWAMMCAANCLPFASIESRTVVAMLARLKVGGADVPGRRLVGEAICLLANAALEAMTADLREAPGFSVVFDIWTSKGVTNTYLGLIFSYLDPKFQPRQDLFAVIHLTARTHDHMYLAHEIALAIDEYAAENQVLFGAVTDNGKNVVKAARQLIMNLDAVLDVNSGVVDTWALENDDGNDADELALFRPHEDFGAGAARAAVALQ